MPLGTPGRRGPSNCDAMACIVLAPTPELDDNPLNGSELMPKLAKAIRRTARVSDILGRLGKREFVIVAPSTNAAGAVTLANRLNRAICEDTQKPPGAAPVLMGYDAVPDVREAPGEAAELLLRAGLAFRRSNGSEWLRAYKDA